MTDARLTRAKDLYEKAVFAGDAEALTVADRDLDGVEADLALARGRILHAKWLAARGDEDPREMELFARAVELYGVLGDERGEGEARFWVGIVHQVLRDKMDPSLPYFERAYELAAKFDDKLAMSYAARHLGYGDQAAGRLDDARVRHEECVRLRREIGFEQGVAPGLLALAEVAKEDGREEDVARLLDEAEASAKAAGADGILQWIAEARKEA